MRFNRTLHDPPEKNRQGHRRSKTALHLEQNLPSNRKRMSKYYGYRLSEDGKLEVNPAEAEIVRMVFKRVLEGQPLQEIKTEMDLRNLHTRFNNRWTIQQIRSLVLRYPEVHPCIVAPAVVQKAIGVLKRMSESTFDPAVFFRD